MHIGKGKMEMNIGTQDGDENYNGSSQTHHQICTLVTRLHTHRDIIR